MSRPLAADKRGGGAAGHGYQDAGEPYSFFSSNQVFENSFFPPSFFVSSLHTVYIHGVTSSHSTFTFPSSSSFTPVRRRSGKPFYTDVLPASLSSPLPQSRSPMLFYTFTSPTLDALIQSREQQNERGKARKAAQDEDKDGVGFEVFVSPLLLVFFLCDGKLSILRSLIALFHTSFISLSPSHTCILLTTPPYIN